ncbi:MAG: peptidylprolyl isomerase [Pseudomonadales bacterium]
MTDGATFSLRLEGIADDEWVLVTVTGGTDIDIDDDNVLDLVPTLNAGEVRALGKAWDSRTSGMNVTVLSKISVRRLLSGNVDLATLDSDSIEIQLTGLAHELLAVDLNSDSILDYKDLLSFTPAVSQNLNVDTFNADELNALAQALESGDNQGVSTLIDAAFAFSTFATIKTNLGDIRLQLFPDLVPNTVNNFSVHARNGFYDGLIFHRVISGFVIQSGDPNGDGSGDTSILGGSFDDEFDATLSNVAGAISMANSGPNTNSSQFFINVVDNTGLDFDKSPSSSTHAVFGQIVEGTDVMLTISNLPTDGQSRPINDVIIETITIDR